MALNGDTLGLAIRAAVDDAVAAHGPSNRAELFKAIGNAIVTHITTNAVVSPEGLPTPLTAPAGGGAVSGTGKVT